MSQISKTSKISEISKLSIVTTLYNSNNSIIEFYERSIAVAKKFCNSYEIIFVNDGSPDNSLEKVIELSQKDTSVKVIDLSRNFGHHRALMIGLSYATGSHVFMLDVDLEEEPEWLSLFYQELMSEPDIDVVFAVQNKRKGNLTEKFSGYIFYKFFNFLTDTKVPESIITCRLMTSRYVKNLIRFQEKEIFIAGLCILNGFKSKQLKVDKKSISETTYSLPKKIALLVNGVTSFSNRPLYFIFYLGAIVTFFSFVFSMIILYRRINDKIVIDGWTSLSMMILIIGGTNLFCTGIVAVYLSKIFSETKERPYKIIPREYNV